VSPAEQYVRHSKRHADHAISQGYSALTTDAAARAAFTDLLARVRERSPSILLAPVVDRRHLGVEALFHLARSVRAHVRPSASWEGSDASWRPAISELAQHLVARHRVPMFFASAWYAGEGAQAESQRQWYVAHGGGARLRSLDLPICLTSRMEHFLLGSPDHLSIECAIRRAELFGLGACADLVSAVLATRLATDLTNTGFWRTVWMFLIANDHVIERAQIRPLVDFLHVLRHERTRVETAAGAIWADPPQPDFSLKGRTPQSLLRLMTQWRRGSGMVTGGLSWTPSRIRPLVIDVPGSHPDAAPVRWQLTELTNGAQLRTEGLTLRHCVGQYAYRCWRGHSRIWSLRIRRDARLRPVATVEIDLKRHAIIQARGYRDRPASRAALSILQTWAWRERLRLAL
jgi:hypothetical protein